MIAAEARRDLVAALGDPSAEVREYAHLALQAIRTPSMRLEVIRTASLRLKVVDPPPMSGEFEAAPKPKSKRKGSAPRRRGRRRR